MPKSHWEDFHRQWARLYPPLRPHPEVVAAFRQLLIGHTDHVMILGVTPELAGMGARVTGVERNQTMIDSIWLGDTATRRAHRGNWLDLPFPAGHFSAVIGDASMPMLTCPDGHRALYAQMERVLQPGGIYVSRLFVNPEDNKDTLESIKERVLARRAGSFNAFKLCVAMALVTRAGNPNIAVADIHKAFEKMFPDRAALASITGWDPEDIATIDAYKDSSDIYSFPTPTELRAAVPDSFINIRFAPSGDYDLAERCPFLVMEHRQ